MKISKIIIVAPTLATLTVPVVTNLTGCSKSVQKEEDLIKNSTAIYAERDSSLTLLGVREPTNPINISYRLGKEAEWKKIDTTTISIPKGTYIYLKGDNPNGINTEIDKFWNLKIEGLVSLQGNIMKLLGESINTIPCDFCFEGLFANSNAIYEISDDFLPATQLTNYCYVMMFNNCVNLVKPPKLPATDLAESCYQQMFCGCEKLLTIPELKAENLQVSCYSSMFERCTSIKNINNLLSFKKTAEFCCDAMFMYCSSLQSIPDNVFPQNELSDCCYQNMFNRCTSIQTMPKIINETLANSCYFGMFEGCTSLSTVCQETLNPTKLTESCYGRMFYRCTALKKAPLLPATKLASGCYENMFTCSGIKEFPENFTIKSDYAPAKCCKCMFESCENLQTLPKLEINSSSQLGSACFKGMFSGADIQSIPNGYLPWTELSDSCYECMFGQNDNLTSVPANLLPATSLKTSCYSGMFNNCPQISTKFDFQHITDVAPYCCQEMFYNCEGLTSFGNLPNANEVAMGCYKNMFEGCKQLKTFDSMSLPATTLDVECYRGMFADCEVLETVPNTLPALAATQHCYNNMFGGCKKITKAPKINLTSLAAYSCTSMFSDCSNLKISSGTGTTQFFTCPDTTGIQKPVEDMFENTTGEYKEDPVTNGIYYYN